MTNTGYGNVESSQTAATFPHSHSHHPQSHEEDDVNLFGPKNCLDNGVHLKCADAEQLLESEIVKAPVIHVDETKISIRGVSHYAWVLTDGKHVVFKLSVSRDVSTIRPLLA